MEELTGGLVAVFVAAAWCALAIRLGPLWGFVDIPDAYLKTHRVVAVPLGGVGVLAGFFTALLVTGRFLGYLVVAALFVLVVGLIDDRWGLSPGFRLVSATGAGFILALMERDQWWGILIVVATVICINAVNLLDGLDALAGSAGGLALAALGWLAASRNHPDWAIPLLASAAVVGFLIWNLPPARVFLGDNGAYVVGLLLAFCAFQVSEDGAQLAVALALIGVPLFDLGVTVLRRFRNGSPLFTGDRDHTYDRLRQQVGGSGRVAAIFALAQAVWVGMLVITEGLFSATAALIVAIVVGMVAVGVAAQPGEKF